MLSIASPGGCEETLRLIAKGGDIDLMALVSLWRDLSRFADAP
jgi:hypothetical protein